jgi:hypothetical protein
MLGDETDFDTAWKMYVWMEATKEWTFLPSPGGLLDQDDLLMENILRIQSVIRKSEKKKP